jgi:hypothetical protein
MNTQQPEVTITIRKNKNIFMGRAMKFHASAAGTALAWAYYALFLGLTIAWCVLDGTHSVAGGIQMFGGLVALALYPAAVRLAVAVSNSPEKAIAIHRTGKEIGHYIYSAWLIAGGVGYFIDPIFGSTVVRVLSAVAVCIGVGSVAVLAYTMKLEREERARDASVIRALVQFGFVQEADEAGPVFVRRCYATMAEKCRS